MTSASVIWMYIKRLYPEARLDFKIHTAKQHGLSDLIDELIEESETLDLILVPDAGSNDEEQHTVLHDCGVPVLCLDHHEVDVQSKNAIIINNQSSPNYKNKQLTGAGIVYQKEFNSFKELFRKKSKEEKAYLKELKASRKRLRKEMRKSK